jgi:hypothetical protein
VRISAGSHSPCQKSYQRNPDLSPISVRCGQISNLIRHTAHDWPSIEQSEYEMCAKQFQKSGTSAIEVGHSAKEMETQSHRVHRASGQRFTLLLKVRMQGEKIE